MEITSQKSGSVLVLSLAGRLDASWCDPVEKALLGSIREGEHHIHLDMARVDYISSAGLRVLFTVYKQLLSIKGEFAIRNPSATVRSVIQMVGIASLISEAAPESVEQQETGEKRTMGRARFEVFPATPVPFSITPRGGRDFLSGAVPDGGPSLRFDAETFAFGVGALGGEPEENRRRFGEFLAVAGAAAFQPSDGSNRPDFVLSEGRLVPEGQLPLGFLGRGGFSRLARFEAGREERSVGLSDLAEAALEIASAPAAALLIVAETAGLVGATLRRSVAEPDTGGDRFSFPAIRDWLAFTPERIHRDTTTLITGVAARPGGPLDALLRPLGRLQGHFHAAVFPYRPLQKGRIELGPTVSSLFETHTLHSVLHLIHDPREINGSGESEFLRGALWIAPLGPDSVRTSEP